MKKMFLLAILIATLSYNNFSQFKANIDTNFLFKKYSNKEDTVVYENFSKLPSDWSIYSQSDTINTKSYISEDNYLTIEHDKTKGVGNDKYYGGVYNIDINNTYKDFTFTMSFKMTNWADGARWIGIVYHSKMIGDNLTGYLMNYRVDNGNSAYSIIDKNKGFHDTASGGNPKLTDKNLHTIKIRMKNNIATHYIDNKEIVTWDTKDANSILGSTYEEGGFSLIVNRSTLNIKKITISNSSDESALESDSTLVDTYQADTSLINGPTNIMEVQNLNDLVSIKETDKKPSNAILNFNKDKNIVSSDNLIIDTASNVIDKYLEHKVIPNFRVNDNESKDALIDFLINDRSLVDVSAISENAELIKEIREKYPYSRGILEVNEIKTSLKDVYFEANINNCPTILLSENIANYENVNYLQSRMKTVWTKLNFVDGNSIHNLIFTGTSGLVSNEFSKIYEKIESYKSDNGKTILTRSPYNVAHRGLPKEYNENSLSGVNAAISKGATHLELDVYMTFDRHIMVSHDNDLSRTTNAPKNTLIEGLNYEDVRKYDLDLFEPFEKVPDIYEVFDILKEDTNETILVCELKTQNSAAINVINDALNNDYPELKDRIVFISFYRNQCKQAHLRAPNIPCADLNTLTTGNFIENLERMGKNGNIIDTPNGSSLLNEKYLRDRGIIGWYWTMDNSNNIDEAIEEGLIGITNNKADYFGKKVKYIKLYEFDNKPQLNVGDDIEFIAYKYNKDTLSMVGTIETITDIDDKQYISIKYRTDKLDRYSPLLEVKVKDQETNKTNKNGCGGNIISTSAIISTIALGGILLLILKKKIGNLNK